MGSIMDPIEVGPLALRPTPTQATGGHITIELATNSEDFPDNGDQPWAPEPGGNYIAVPIRVWEAAHASIAELRAAWEQHG